MPKATFLTARGNVEVRLLLESIDTTKDSLADFVFRLDPYDPKVQDRPSRLYISVSRMPGEMKISTDRSHFSSEVIANGCAAARRIITSLQDEGLVYAFVDTAKG